MQFFKKSKRFIFNQQGQGARTKGAAEPVIKNALTMNKQRKKNKTVTMGQESKLSCGSCGMRGRYKDSAMTESEPGN